MKDAIGALIRISRRFDPRVAARIDWMRERFRGDLSLRIMERFVKRGTSACDIGANWGLYAWQLGRLVGATGHVYVVEPDPMMAPSLRAIRGRCTNMTIHGLALSDHTGEAELHVPVHNGLRASELASLAVPRERAALTHERHTVKLERLDRILPPEVPIAFIKCDVEGHELPVLRGAEATLRRWRPILLVEIEQRHQAGGGNVQEALDHLVRLGYVGYSVHAHGLRPLAEFDLQRDQLAFLGPEFRLYGMPREYVNDFLFTGSGTNLGGLLAPPRASPDSTRVVP